MADKNNNRLARVDEELKKEISSIINYKLKNPKITGIISVTKVNISPDLKYAKVYVSILNAKNTKETFSNLKKSAGFIRTEIAKNINLKFTPELIFILDDQMEYGAKIDEILKKILPNKEEQ